MDPRYAAFAGQMPNPAGFTPYQQPVAPNYYSQEPPAGYPPQPAVPNNIQQPPMPAHQYDGNHTQQKLPQIPGMNPP